MEEYIEQEIKVLDVDVLKLEEKLLALGAKKVFDDNRTIIALDTKDKKYLKELDKLIRVTEEGTTKVTMHINQSKIDEKREIKFKTSRLKETLDFFKELGLIPQTEVTARRISYELNEIDFDIDIFGCIPPFLEIDIASLSKTGYTKESLLEALGLQNNRVVIMGTEDIHELYGINYFEIYKKWLKYQKICYNKAQINIKRRRLWINWRRWA